MSDKAQDEIMDKGFNDDELQDIMNEIESLEKEYVEQETPAEVTSEAVEEAVAQETTEEAVEEEAPVEVHASEESEEDEEVDEVLSEAEAEADDEYESEQDNVVSFKPVQAPTHRTNSESVSFSGNGQIDFSMTFSIGGEEATITVNQGEGLTVTMNGVDLSLSEDGCTVEMTGGVKFSVPLGTNTVNKKAV